MHIILTRKVYEKITKQYFSKNRYLLNKLLLIAVLVSLTFVSGAYVGHRLGLTKGVRLGIAHTRKSIDPLSDNPILIFQKKNVRWNELAGNIDAALVDWTANTKLMVLGTFPTPGTKENNQHESTLEVNSNEINFPEFGEYYLRTTLGNLKILILDPKQNSRDQLRALATFVSRNSVHSLADARTIQPNAMYYNNHRPDKLLRKLFASDQPVELHCGYIAELLNYIANQQGFKARRLQLYTDGRRFGHIVSQIFLADENKWVMVDPDYGAVVEDQQGNWLSIEEIAYKARNNRTNQLVVVDLAMKKSLLPEFNPPSHFLTPFTWTPETMSDIPMVEEEKYRDLMKHYTSEYILFDYDETFQWVTVKS